MCSDICNEGITQFYLPPTYKPYLPLLPSRKASPTLVLIAPTHRMDGWLYTKINVQHRELNLDMVTHPSSNRARRRLNFIAATTPDIISTYVRDNMHGDVMFDAIMTSKHIQWRLAGKSH